MNESRQYAGDSTQETGHRRQEGEPRENHASGVNENDGANSRGEEHLFPSGFSGRARVFTETVVWKKAHSLVLDVYRISQRFPREETFGLTSQLRRAAISVPGNFAEGFKRRTLPEKLRFFTIAQGSLEECRYYLILAHDLKYAGTRSLLASLDEVGKLLAAYAKAVSLQIEKRKP